VLKGQCPFHQDSTPSLTVYPSTGDFHCFGCQANGTVIDYIMYRLNTKSVGEALMYISHQYDIPLSGFDEEAYKERKSAIENKRREATNYFKHFQEANKFLVDRKISGNTLKKFGVGFDTTKQAVAIPFLNTYGEVVGMSFRFFDKDKPKYMNESETGIFNKSQLLYGLDKARKHTKEKVYICEGYFDVMALHEMGIESSVAYCGGTMTDGQVNLLKQYITKDTKIYLIPDNDKTGMKEVHSIIAKLQLSLKNRIGIIELPKGIKDANDLLIVGKNIKDIKPTHVLMFQLKAELDKCLDREDEYEVARDFSKRTVNQMLKQEMVRYLAKRWKEDFSLVSRHMDSSLPEESLLNHIHGFQETFVDYQNEVTNGNKSVIKTGYKELDERIPRSLKKKELIYVLGRSGSGKTTFALNIAYNAIHHQGKTVAMFSIELARTAVMPQFIQIHKRWTEKKVELLAAGVEKYDDELSYLMQKFEEKLRFVDKEGITLNDIENYVRVMNEQIFPNPVDMVIIDYFGMIKRSGKKDNYHELSDQARELKEMAKRLDCTVVCLTQANRDGGKDGSEPLSLQASRDTGAIEESGDYVLGIYRPGLRSTLDPNERVLHEKEMRVQVLKARWGIVGECLLEFDGKTKKIDDWPDDKKRP
jgi:replicative DNA helicase/5S rRNA maturation endonuclease (ribonuclease M5)